jgi:hypothetical protein
MRALPLILSAIVFTGCIKQEKAEDNTTRPIVEFTDAQSGGQASVDFGTNTINIDLTEIRLRSTSKAGQPLRIKLTANPALVPEYNQQNGTSFEALPASLYTWMPEVSLSQNERSKMIGISLNPSMLVGKEYAMGLAIAEVVNGEVSSTKANVVVAVKVKNAYEGSYTATGTRILYSGTTNTSGVANTVTINTPKYLYTIDQTTVETDVADLIGGGYMFLRIDPQTNQVTVLPSSVSPTFLLSNDGPCTYNPSTRTFTLKYKYFNASGLLREITETIKRN